MPKKPITPSPAARYAAVREEIKAIAKQVAETTPKKAVDQVWRTKDQHLVRIVEAREDGSVVVRTIHAAPGVKQIPYEQLLHFPPHLLFLLTEKVSD